MVQDNIIVFKGKKDGIVIVLDDKASFEDLKATLSVKIADAAKFFSGAKMSITFQGRELSEVEESELLEIVIAEANLNVSFVKSSDAMEQAEIFRPRERRSRSMEAPPREPFNPSEHSATIHRGALRSGRSIRYSGSVVVLGDVNPGAEVIAEGNIIVLGTVMGLVHAGCSGSTDCFVSALNLSPVQIRIADKATYIPDDVLRKNKKKPVPSYAYIENGQIYIAPLI